MIAEIAFKRWHIYNSKLRKWNTIPHFEDIHITNVLHFVNLSRHERRSPIFGDYLNLRNTEKKFKL